MIMKRYTRKVNGKVEWEYHKLLPDEDAEDLIRGACLEMGFVPIDSGIYTLKTDEGLLKVIWQGEERHGWLVEINNYSEVFMIRQSLFDTIRSVWTHERKNPLALPVVFSSKEIEEILGG